MDATIVIKCLCEQLTCQHLKPVSSLSLLRGGRFILVDEERDKLLGIFDRDALLDETMEAVLILDCSGC